MPALELDWSKQTHAMIPTVSLLRQLGLDEALDVATAVDTACTELHIVSEGSLKAKVLALCAQLHVDLNKSED
eukprot:COSAG06_NODE_358_length_16848_cov_13.836587_8_plen_73_part_00